MEQRKSNSKIPELLTDDVIPPFLAKKLELCRQLDSVGWVPPTPIMRKSSRRMSSPDASLEMDLETHNKRNAFLRSIFNDNKLNHRQKEHIAANILIGKQDSETNPLVFTHKTNSISPLRVGNILTDGHRLRHAHNRRTVELVGDSVEIKPTSMKDLRSMEISKRREKNPKPSVYTWANEAIESVSPYKLSSQRSFEGVQPCANREFIIDQISHHNSLKAKRNADQVRNLKATALFEKSNLGNDVLQEVAVKKKLKKFREKLNSYLQKKGEPQRGEIMRCIDDETIYKFMENFKGYSMVPDMILSLLGTSLGAAASEGVLLVPERSVDGKSGYLPVQSSYDELSPHLRELRIETLPPEPLAHDHSFSNGFIPHTIFSPSYSAKPSPPKSTSTCVNGFKVIPRNSSRMGSGFMVHKAAAAQNSTKSGSGDSSGIVDLSIAGAAAGMPIHRGVGSICRETVLPPNAASAGDLLKISAGEDKGTWVTDLENSPSRHIAMSLDVAINDSFQESVEAPPPVKDLAEPMRSHMTMTNTLPSLFPEKVLTEEELEGLGKKTMTFEEIAIKKERAALLAKRAMGKKPVTGLAGLKSSTAIKSMAPPTVKTQIPRFIITPKSGGDEFFPKSPNPAVVPIEHFGDDC